MPTPLTIVPRFLRDPQAFFRSVRQNEAVKSKTWSLAVSSILFLALYGFTMGLSHSLPQALSSAVKMPLVLIVTVAFCLPALYFFSLAVLSTPLNMLQVATVVLTGVGVTAFLLLGLSPVMLFFVLTSESYAFFQLLTVIFVALSGCIGLYFLWRGMMQIEPRHQDSPRGLSRGVLLAWLVLYVFVSTQMTWRLSPLVGDPTQPFILLQPSRDNFYIDVLHALERALGITVAYPSGPRDLLAVGFLCGLGLLIFLIGAWLGPGLLKNKGKSQAVPDREAFSSKGAGEPTETPSVAPR